MAIRYGVQTDNPADIDARIRRIEQELQFRALANFQGTESAYSPTVGENMQFRLVPSANSSVGGIVVTWNPAPIKNVLRYEVQYADNQFMLDATTTFTRDTFYTIQSTDTDTQKYVRVRARNADNNRVSLWSSVLNAETGLITTTDIVPGAASEVFEDFDDLTGEPLIDVDATAADYTASDSYVHTEEISTEGGVLLPFSLFTYQIAHYYNTGAPSGFGTELQFDLSLYRINSGGGGDALNSAVSSKPNFTVGYQPGLYAGVPSIGQPGYFYTLSTATIVGLGNPDQTAAAGNYQFRLDVDLGVGSTGGGDDHKMQFKPVKWQLSVIELRR